MNDGKKMHAKQSIYNQSKDELSSFLKKYGYSEKLSDSLLQNTYKRKKIPEAISDKLQSILNLNFTWELPSIEEVQHSGDGTIKFLLKFNDGNSVETVLIPFNKKFTVCLSTQVGCAMKCSFCYTGTMGLKRHLKTEEIIGQYMVAWNYLREVLPHHQFTPNIVFMGQGEPLHNAEAVEKSLKIFMEPFGLGIGPRQMTLSTAGFIPGIKKFKSFPKINLALSLHSPFHEIRSQLIPINEQYPLKEVLGELEEIEKHLIKKQFITYEYLLIKGLNDRPEDALELGRLFNKRKALINLIPFNPFPGSTYQRPSDEEVEGFKELLVEQKLRTLVRITKGSDILAACGQLKSSK